MSVGNKNKNDDASGENIPAKLPVIARPLELHSGNDKTVEDIKSLLGCMLLNKRDSLKSWLSGLLSNDLSFCESSPMAMKKKKSQLRRSYDDALKRVSQHPDRDQRVIEITKLACVSFIPEAEVWETRGDVAKAKAQFGRLSAALHFADAEEYYAKAFFYYRDLRDKYQSLVDLQSSQVNSVAELAIMQAKMEEIQPKIYNMRLQKHFANIFTSMTDKKDPKVLLYSLVSLANVLVEYDPKKGVAVVNEANVTSQDMNVFIKNNIATMLISLNNTKICKQLFASLSHASFGNLCDALWWMTNRAQDFNLPGMVQDLLNQYAINIEDAIDEGWDKEASAEESNDILLKLRPLYEAKCDAHRLRFGCYVELNETQKLLLLDAAKEELVQQQQSVLEAQFPDLLGGVSYQLWMFMSALREGVADALTSLAKRHPQLQEFCANDPQLVEQEFLEAHEDYDKLIPKTRSAAYNTVKAIMANNLWLPLIPHASRALNPTEIDIRDKIYDNDVIEELTRDRRSSQCLIT